MKTAAIIAAAQSSKSSQNISSRAMGSNTAERAAAVLSSSAQRATGGRVNAQNLDAKYPHSDILLRGYGSSEYRKSCSRPGNPLSSIQRQNRKATIENSSIGQRSLRPKVVNTSAIQSSISSQSISMRSMGCSAAYLISRAIPPTYVTIAEIATSDQVKNCSLRFDAFMCGAAFENVLRMSVSMAGNAAAPRAGGLS
jgi:hypothetical protein